MTAEADPPVLQSATTAPSERVATLKTAMLGAALLAIGGFAFFGGSPSAEQTPPGRQEVVFWHFWGGKDRPVVEDVVRRFNASQSRYYVRAVAMPGNNLDLKFFMSVAGGDPPDLLNQDDPIVADWAHRGALTPLDQLATREELEELPAWLSPPAKALGTYKGRLYALCNGLDIRALYYDKTLLDSFGLQPPATIAELDETAVRIAPLSELGPRRKFGYLPDPRRIWAWGIVFGGRFYDPQSRMVTADSEPIVRALEWMQSYSDRYGAENVLAFRHGDQALTGSSFPLLEGRYALIMDGQWRVAEIEAAQQDAKRRGRPVTEYGVVPLPSPPNGLKHAGWVNGNFFVVPKGSRNPRGAWEFMKFWSGFGGHEAEAAQTCAAGGWIPASQAVVQAPSFQRYLQSHPLFAKLVELANSENQVPTPNVPGAAYFQTEVIRAAEDSMYRGRAARQSLAAATRRIQARLDEIADEAR